MKKHSQKNYHSFVKLESAPDVIFASDSRNAEIEKLKQSIEMYLMLSHREDVRYMPHLRQSILKTILNKRKELHLLSR